MVAAGDQVLLEGRVDAADPNRLSQILNANKGTITTVILRNSPGGVANSGYEIGAMIRAAGLRTAVSGFCRSSCSRMFLGGKERFVTDEQRPGLTHVGFHGNYDSNGNATPEGAMRLRGFIAEYSGGKADTALVERWTELRKNSGFMYFFHPKLLNRTDGVSMFLCQGNEPRNDRFNNCEKFPGRDGLEMGIFTSLDVIKVNEAIRLKKAVADDEG